MPGTEAICRPNRLDPRFRGCPAPDRSPRAARRVAGADQQQAAPGAWPSARAWGPVRPGSPRSCRRETLRRRSGSRRLAAFKSARAENPTDTADRGHWHGIGGVADLQRTRPWVTAQRLRQAQGEGHALATHRVDVHRAAEAGATFVVDHVHAPRQRPASWLTWSAVPEGRRRRSSRPVRALVQFGPGGDSGRVVRARRRNRPRGSNPAPSSATSSTIFRAFATQPG